jgi:tetratricopeptide (TPR) repeat protein
MSPSLDGERAVAPWRGAVAAAQHDWAGALRQFVRGESLVDHYPSALRLQFALSAAEAALEVGDPSQARVYLETANNLKPSNGAADRSHWLMGRMYAAFSEYDSADKEWTLAMSGGDPSIQARARFDRAMTFLDAGRMSRADAIAELEKLQFAWRGDALEYTMLTTLGDLYLQNGDLRKGLTSLRKAVTNFPSMAGVDAVSARMRDAFVQFHSDGRAAALPTLTELALFQEFRDLVPDEPTGDAIENQLVGRLIEVDLLEPTEDLLGELADRRLKGAAESKARNQLGLVFLMDRKPEKAAEALDRPVAADADDDTVNTRRQLRARALMDLEKYDEALKLLNGDDSSGATALRADLFWRTNDWKQASDAFGKLTASLDPAKLTDSDVRLVLRNAIALALAGNDRTQVDVGKRFGPAMATTPYKDAFSILTDARQLLTPANLRTLIDQVSAAERFGTFLDGYRSQLLSKGAATPISSKDGAGPARAQAQTVSTAVN